MPTIYPTFMKVYILIFFSMFINAGIFAQDTVHVFVNKNHAARFISNPAVLSGESHSIKAPDAAKVYVQLEPVSKNSGPYKQSLEITDCHETESNTFSLTANSYGQVDITEDLKKYNFYKGCYVKFYLLLNPANEMMALPSKRIYLGDLSLK